jgi:hypothetical protein
MILSELVTCPSFARGCHEESNHSYESFITSSHYNFFFMKQLNNSVKTI